MSHPAPFNLELVYLGAGTEADRQHLAQCEACSAYVGRLQQPVALPTDLRAWVSRPQARRAWLVPLAALAAAAAVMVVTQVSQQPREDIIRTKGSPAVTLYIKRDSGVAQWDGQAPIQPGDSIRLAVQPEGFLALQVLSSGQILFRGYVSRPRQELPLSWRVDSDPNATELTLVFSSLPLTLEQALMASRLGTRDGEIWVTTLMLRKEAAPEMPP